MATINDRIKKLINSIGKTKTEIARTLDVTPAYLSKLIKTGTPSDMFISNLCRNYNVDEEWLRTGEGEMFVIQSKEEELAAFFGDILNDGSSFKKRFISALAALDTEDWEVIEKFINSIIAEKKERGEL
jgi:transcriptional regulator with XRE-family HTH domain